MSENITFTCEATEIGKRWKCTSADGTKTWFAGEQYRYKGKLAGEEVTEQPPLPTVPPKTVDATESGVDGNKIFKIIEITGGKNPQAAIDGKKSTYSEGKEIIAELEGVGWIRTFAIKFEGGPYSFNIFTSINKMDWIRIPLGDLTDEVHHPGDMFHYFVMPKIVAATWVKLQSEQDMKIITLQLLDTDPDPTGEPTEQPPVVIPPTEVPDTIPIPPDFTLKGPILLQKFEHWGRHSTNYASGGSGPSERWDLSDLPNAINVLAGYEVNLGEESGEKGEDNFDMKLRGSGHSDSNGGWYIPSFTWSGFPHIGKEYPHPKTEHLKIQTKGDEESLGNMKGDFWVGYMAACFNDEKGVPTMMLWGKPKGKDTSNKFEDYVYMGMSKDTGNMKPGPVLTKIGMMGSKLQRLQIRMDEVPQAKIRNAWAVEIEPPKNDDGGLEPPIEQPKPEPEPKPIVEGEYTSASWPTEKLLKLEETFERLNVRSTGDVEPTAKIENGILKVTGSSPRVYYDGPWQDVEMSADIMFVKNMDQSYIIGRSNHQVRPCGFGGHDLYVSLSDKSMFFKKEIHHDLCPEDGFHGYSGRLNSVDVDVKEGVWFNQKLRVTNEGKNVKIEGFFNDKKMLEIIDSGQIECDGKKTPPFQGIGQWCYTRANAEDQSKAGEIHYKNVKITPITS